jgi:hypothetical protein
VRVPATRRFVLLRTFVTGAKVESFVQGPGFQPILLAAVAALGIALLGGPLGSRASAQPTANPQSKGFALTILDSVGDWPSPADTSVAIGADGLALISYYDGANGDLKVAHCRNVACRAATTVVIDHEGDVGRWNSVAIGADGLGLVSYYDATKGDLKVAHCQNVACSAAMSATIETDGGPSSIAVGADGLGLIAFEAGGALKVAHCSDVVCSTATTATVDAVQGEPHPSITIGTDGLGLISYVDRTEDEGFGLNVAHCSDAACSTATTATPLPLFAELVTSITIGTDGLGLISVADIDSNAAVVHCSNLICSAATSAYLGVDFVRASSITVGADGLGLVSSARGDALGLNVAQCQDLACTSATSTSVDPSIFAEGYTSIEIGVDGFPLISYYDDSDLKVAHCSNPACVPRR